MELTRNIRKQTNRTHCVATIGNFDGVHLGHQAVFNQLKQNSDELGLPAVVITFEPLPLEFFKPKSAPVRLTDFRNKIELLASLSIDHVACLRFEESLASLSAEFFVKDILIEGLGIKRLIVGDDFRFGKNRIGNVELLHQMGQQFGFDVKLTESFQYNGKRVTSSLVRGHLAMGNFQEVSELLGREYRLSGKVVHGDKRGRELGFQTANIVLKNSNYPLSGVYVVRVHTEDNAVYNGVTSIGTRPVFNGKVPLMETHIFDFDSDIYGRRISVGFLKHLRNEEHFPTIEALCEQMGKDVQRAKNYFEKLGVGK